jgi:hypothetical protein
MAWPAQAFEVAVGVGAAVRFGCNVVHRGGRCDTVMTLAFLAKMFVAFQYARTYRIPQATITTFMSALALLVVNPVGIAVCLTVA